MAKKSTGRRKRTTLRSNGDIRARKAVFNRRIDEDIEQIGAVGKIIARSKTVPRMHAKKHR